MTDQARQPPTLEELGALSQCLRARLTTITEVAVLTRTGRVPIDALHGCVLALDMFDDSWWSTSERHRKLDSLCVEFAKVYEDWKQRQEADSARNPETGA
jgi:hypothetical protein